MSNSGLRTCAEPAAHSAVQDSVKRLGLGLSLIGLLLLGACASNGNVSDVPNTQAQNDLRTNTIFLGEPLDGTVAEGTAAGGILGTGLSVGIGAFSGSDRSSVGFALPVAGMVVGNLAGRYVSAKQSRYGAELELVEAITQDVRTKNQHAERTITSMEIVVAEDRARLAELREARSKDQVSEDLLDQQIAVAERDLATMRQAVAKAEEHYETFARARAIVAQKNSGPAIGEMDTEIDVLRARIDAMKGLVDELTSVS